MKGHASKLLMGFNVRKIIEECSAGKFVFLRNVRLLKLSTTHPAGIAGDFKYSKILKDDGEFVKYAPLTTEAYWLTIQQRPDNMGKNTVPLKIDEVKMTVRLPEYAARLFRSHTDDGENVVLKGMSRPYSDVDDLGRPVTVWEGIIAMFPEEGQITTEGEVHEADAYTDFMDEKLGFGMHQDLIWREVPAEYLDKAKFSFTEENKHKAVLELERRRKEAEAETAEGGVAD